jgi:hypothetical protein
VTLGQLTLDQLQRALAKPTDASRVRDATTLVSISFAVLSAFTTQRATSATKQGEDLSAVTRARLRLDLAIDVGLLVFGLLLLVALGPLFTTSVANWTFWDTGSAFFGAFALLYLAIALTLSWLGYVVRKRAKVLSDKD